MRNKFNLLIAVTIVFSSCASVPDLIAKGDLKKAEETCEELSVNQQKECLELIGDAYLEKGEREKASSKYAQLAQIYYGEEDFINAARLFYKTETTDGQAQKSLFEAADQLWEKKEFSTAIKYYVKAGEEYEKTLIDKIISGLEKDYLIKELSVADKKECFELIANIFFSNSRKDDAARYFEELGNVYYNEQNYQLAAKYYYRTGKSCFFGNISKSMQKAADELWKAKNYIDAMKYYEYCTDYGMVVLGELAHADKIKSGLMSDADLIALSQFYIQNKDDIRALKYGKAVKSDTWNPGELNTIGDAYFSADKKILAAEWYYLGKIKTENAFSAYRAAIANANNNEYYFRAAQYYELMEDYLNAGRSYDKMGYWFLAPRRNNFKSASGYFENASNMYQKAGKSDLAIASTFMIALPLIENLNFDEARPYVKKLVQFTSAWDAETKKNVFDKLYAGNSTFIGNGRYTLGRFYSMLNEEIEKAGKQ